MKKIGSGKEKKKTENGCNTDLELVLFLLEELLLGLGQFLVYALHEERRVRLHAQRIHHSVYQSSGSGSSISSESGSGSRVLMTKNLKEKKYRKKIVWNKNCNLLMSMTPCYRKRLHIYRTYSTSRNEIY